MQEYKTKSSTILSINYLLLTINYFAKRTQFSDSTNLQYTISNIQSKKRTQFDDLFNQQLSIKRHTQEA